MKNQRITISGTAQNGKAGALVKTSDGNVYYLEGVSMWPSELVNREVKVTGDLSLEEVLEEDLKNERGEWNQGVTGTIRILKQAQWKKE